MDLVYSPQGGLIGEAGAAGIIHLHLCDSTDAALGALPGQPDDSGGRQNATATNWGSPSSRGPAASSSIPMDLGGYPVPPDFVADLSFDDASDLDGNPATRGYWQSGACIRLVIASPRGPTTV